MKKLLLLIPLVVFIFSTHVTQAQGPQQISQTLYTNAYQFYESEDNWYTTTIEYMREDERRVYFGGYITDSSDESRIGKWISGSVPTDSLTVVEDSIPLSEIVY